MQLKIEHLSFTYDGAPEAVFADLSLSLDTAWRTGLIARNGRGKTTLLRLLSGDLQGKGKIDCPLTPVLFPYPVADGTQTAWQIAQTAAPTCEDWRLMRELSLLNVPEEALNRPFDTLSGGEQTRVMLSALFAREDAYPSTHPAVQCSRTTCAAKTAFCSSAMTAPSSTARLTMWSA